GFIHGMHWRIISIRCQEFRSFVTFCSERVTAASGVANYRECVERPERTPGDRDKPISRRGGGPAMTGDRIVSLRPGADADPGATMALIAAARSRLAEAQTLPDIRRVIEAAGVAVDAAQRAAKLAQAQRMASEVVEAANAAANDAAAVRIEAQARAGELL